MVDCHHLSNFRRIDFSVVQFEGFSDPEGGRIWNPLPQQLARGGRSNAVSKMGLLLPGSSRVAVI